MTNESEVILRRLLDKIAKQEEYEGHQLEITQVSTKGASYTSLLFSITMSANNKEDLKLFAKVATFGEAMRSQIQDVTANSYVAEPYAYSILAEAYKSIQDKYKVPDEHKLMMPKYYGHDDTYLEEVIVVEDLTARGFIRHDRLKCIDWEHASESIGQLAKLHALSIAIQDEYPEKFEEAAKVCQFNKPEICESTQKVLQELKANALSTVSEEYREKLQIYLEKTESSDFKEEYFKLIRPMLTHGDFRKDNLMHREKENGESDVIILDYQCLAVGHWMRDFLYLVLTATDEEFRARHFHQLIEHYYEHLCITLRRFDRDPEIDFPRADFDYDVEKNLPHGLFLAVFLLPVITADQENTVEVNKDIDFDCLMTVQTSSVYEERLNGLVRDYVRWGLI